MASLPERACTCKLPLRKDTSFLRFICPDWSNVDIIGQTILLKELAARFGSFQKACVALKLQDNEVESFLLTYLEYQQAAERGRIVAEQWGRDLAVPADYDEDIPQQRPLLVCATSIAPACDFLEALGYQDHVPAVQAWKRRIITWPPYIDVTDFDALKLSQAHFPFPTFPTIQQQPTRSKYAGSLDNDTRALVAFVGAWQPKVDETPDIRLSFIDLPDGSVAYGPRGPRQLYGAGRYYVCWSTDNLFEKQYSDLVLARNNFGSQEDGNNRFGPSGLGGSKDTNTRDTLKPLGPEEGWDPELEALETGERLLVTHTALPGDLTVDPKDVFGKGLPDAYDPENKLEGSFHPEDEPQGPLRKVANPELQQPWSSWPGQIFQFRLPRGYTIIGPLGHLHTFDLPQYETHDEMGNPRGIGGTYHIVPPQRMSRPMSFKMEDLPDRVAFRLKIQERMTIVRNGMVLPRFVEPGAHEWSTREGFLDFYSAHGCYDVLQAEGRYNDLSEFTITFLTKGTYQAGGHTQPADHSEKRRVNLSPIEEAQEILAPHRDWLDRQEAEEKRLEREIEERAKLDAKIARDKTRQDILKEQRKSRKRALEIREAQEKASVDAIVQEDTGVSQDAPKRRVRRKRNSGHQFDMHLSNMPPNTQPEDTHQQEQQCADSVVDGMPKPENGALWSGRTTGTSRRKRSDDQEDDEYIPRRPRPPRRSRAWNSGLMPRKLLTGPAASVSNIGDSQSCLAPKNRRARGTAPQAQAERYGPSPSSASTTMNQTPLTLTRTYRPRSAIDRKPIGPLLDAIEANPVPEGSSVTALQLFTAPQCNGPEIITDPVDGNASSEGKKKTLRIITVKPSTVPETAPSTDRSATGTFTTRILRYDPGDTECEMNK
ncbi:hypothetical protein HD806DRAFT_529994 [Xylariaceae sp. AK1471]|nr:hypothetical protein HD806DRAFT_529994 [Xylariaceae sp. AK1471]